MKKFIVGITVMLMISLPIVTAQLMVEMEPLREIKVNAMKRDVNNPLTVSQLDKEDKVMLTIERISYDSMDDDFVQVAIIDGNSTEPVYVDLIPGTYSFDAQLLWFKNITIPEEKRDFCMGITGKNPKQIGSSTIDVLKTQAAAQAFKYAVFRSGLGHKLVWDAAGTLIVQNTLLGNIANSLVFGPWGWGLSAAYILAQVVFKCIGKTKSVIIPAMQLYPVPLGGAKMSEETGALWNLKPEKLDSKDEITFYVFEYPAPVMVEQLSASSEYHIPCKKYPNLVMPD